MAEQNVVHEMMESTAAQNTVTIGTTSTAFIPRSDKRVAIVLNPPLTNRYTISMVNPAVLDVGITVYPGQWPVILSLQDVGDLTRRDWWAISAVAGQAVTYVETLSTCDCAKRY
jgi:hypothetical protein